MSAVQELIDAAAQTQAFNQFWISTEEGDRAMVEWVTATMNAWWDSLPWYERLWRRAVRWFERVVLNER